MPYPLNYLNLNLVIILFLLLFDDLALLYYWTILSSFLLSLSSSLPLPIMLASWFLTILACYATLYQFLTNRSLYSLLLLTSLGTIILELCIIIGAYANEIFTGINLHSSAGNHFASLAYSIALNMAAMAVLFYFVHSINSKLKPFLLLKRRN